MQRREIKFGTSRTLPQDPQAAGGQGMRLSHPRPGSRGDTEQRAFQDPVGCSAEPGATPGSAPDGEGLGGLRKAEGRGPVEEEAPEVLVQHFRPQGLRIGRRQDSVPGSGQGCLGGPALGLGAHTEENWYGLDHDCGGLSQVQARHLRALQSDFQVREPPLGVTGAYAQLADRIHGRTRRRVRCERPTPGSRAAPEA